jgi:hypothetical protein
MWENLRLNSDGGDFGRRKCKRRYGDAYGTAWRRLRLARLWSQAVGFVLVRLEGIWLQSRADVFTLNLLYEKYKFCTSNTIFKSSAAINSITIQYKNVSFTSTLTAHMLGYFSLYSST